MYELIILGAGPAGLAAAVLAKKYQIKTAIIDTNVGGKVKYAHNIENWLGETSISGEELNDRFIKHVNALNIEIINDQANKIERQEDGSFSIIGNGAYQTKNIILASGSERNKLNIPGEDVFNKKGVYYSAVKDGSSYKNKIVAVIGSGDSACTTAIFLSKIAKEVYLIYRSDSLKAEPNWIAEINKTSNINLIPNAKPESIIGHDVVEHLKLSNKKTLDIDGIFIEIGFKSSKSLLKDLAIDSEGYIIVESDQSTNIKNIWAAGDNTTNSGKNRQIITAVAEGSVAATSVYNEIKNNNSN
jgi:thioredoxin reductase (NADPH)